MEYRILLTLPSPLELRLPLNLDPMQNRAENWGTPFFKRLVYITYIPVAISSLMMLYGIVAGRSMYPRWMVVFLPIVIYLLKTPVTRILKGHLQEIINDSYDNIVLFVFYVLSTVVLMEWVSFLKLPNYGRWGGRPPLCWLCSSVRISVKWRCTAKTARKSLYNPMDKRSSRHRHILFEK